MTAIDVTAARRVSRTVTLPASPAEVFDLLADPRKHPAIDGSGAVRTVVEAPDRLGQGAEFTMRMKAGVSYTTRNVVVAFDPDREIAWRHRARHVWNYALRAVPGGTEVTETFDWSAKRAPRLVAALGVPRAAGRAIDATLERLGERFAG